MNQVKIGDVCTLEKGTTGLAKAYPGEYPLVATGAERKTSREYQFDAKAVCIPLVSSTGHGRKTLNYVHYQEGKFALGTILVAVTPDNDGIINARYLHLYLQKNKDRVLVPLMKGAANVSLSVKDIANIEIPLPSTKEQDEIISKVDSISDEYLEFLNEADIQFNLLEQLRQSILQEAIEGKLTEKWRYEHPEPVSGDNHAFKLLENIKAERERLIKEGKIKKEKPITHIRDEEKLFELPEGWVWCRLGECSINKDGPRQPVSQIERQHRAKIYPYYGASGVIDKIDGYTHDGRNLLIGEDGANLLLRSTPIAFIADGKYWVNNHAHVIGFFNEVTLRFIETHINAIDIRPYITGGFQPKLNQENLNRILIAFPPLYEQQAIIDRIDKLMIIVDDLEKQLSERKGQSEMLMQSVLREAFTTS